jgi:hypothetical protein
MTLMDRLERLFAIVEAVGIFEASDCTSFKLALCPVFFQALVAAYDPSSCFAIDAA